MSLRAMRGFLDNFDAGERAATRLFVPRIPVGSGGVPWPGWLRIDNLSYTTQAPLRALNLFKAIPDVCARG